MPEIEIRPVKEDDIQSIVEIEHNYSSEFVWQMDIKQGNGEVNISFREVRLPRSTQVSYPKQYKELINHWTDCDGLLIAEIKGLIVGYVSLSQTPALKTTWVSNIAVMKRYRRQGIGSALILAAQEWTRQKTRGRLILEMQPKNYPAIQMAKKLGFDLCGYNDHYYANGDIALFFSKWIG